MTAVWSTEIIYNLNFSNTSPGCKNNALIKSYNDSEEEKKEH